MTPCLWANLVLEKKNPSNNSFATSWMCPVLILIKKNIHYFYLTLILPYRSTFLGFSTSRRETFFPNISAPHWWKIDYVTPPRRISSP
jgi:hypothetical protein